MKLILKNNVNKHIEETFIQGFDSFRKICEKFCQAQEDLEAHIFAVNEIIKSHELEKFKTFVKDKNISILHIYSNNRETVLASRSLKIDTTYANEKEVKKKEILYSFNQRENILHQGTVRSGDRICSNGDLVIIGDVNPGAIVTAKRNVYVWGKLLGIAFAGQGGNKNAFIASLHLNPLQLRINDFVAIGPKEKPKDFYPEIALLKDEEIIIEPYLIDNFK